MIPEDASFESIVEFFNGDKFATVQTGCVLVEAQKGHAVAKMPITPNHRNGMGGVMGGAIFTLADFALAVACNVGEEPTVSVSNNIQFMNGAKGDELIATCDVDKSGRRLGFYTVKVEDNTGRLIAVMTATCHR